MKRYLPCVVFAVVVSTASARPQVLLGQDPFSFGASAAQDPFGAPAAQDPFGTSAFQDTFEASEFQDPFGPSAFQNPFGASASVGGNTGGIPLSDVTGGENPLLVFDGAAIDSAGNNGVVGPSDFGTVGLASFDDPFAGTVGLASLDDPFSGTGLSNDLIFGPEAAPVLPTALAAVPVFVPTSAEVFAPASAQPSDPVLDPSPPGIANEILSGPVDVLLPVQEPVPESVTRSSSIPAFPDGAPEYAPDSTSTGSDSTSAPATVAPPGITLITKANLVYTSFDVAEVNHARDAAALAAAIAGTTGTSAPVAPVAPADPTSVAAVTPAAERATPNFSISIDPVLLSDVADITAAPAPADIYLDPTQ